MKIRTFLTALVVLFTSRALVKRVLGRRAASGPARRRARMNRRSARPSAGV